MKFDLWRYLKVSQIYNLKDPKRYLLTLFMIFILLPFLKYRSIDHLFHSLSMLFLFIPGYLVLYVSNYVNKKNMGSITILSFTFSIMSIIIVGFFAMIYGEIIVNLYLYLIMFGFLYLLIYRRDVAFNYKSINLDYYDKLLLLVITAIFLKNIFYSNVSLFRFPDENLYMYLIKNLIPLNYELIKKQLAVDGNIYIILYQLKLGYLLLSSFFNEFIANYDFIYVQLLNQYLYIISLFVMYYIGSSINKKVGLISTILLGFNPFITYLSYRNLSNLMGLLSVLLIIYFLNQINNDAYIKVNYYALLSALLIFNLTDIGISQWYIIIICSLCVVRKQYHEKPFKKYSFILLNVVSLIIISIILFKGLSIINPSFINPYLEQLSKNYAWFISNPLEYSIRNIFIDDDSYYTMILNPWLLNPATFCYIFGGIAIYLNNKKEYSKLTVNLIPVIYIMIIYFLWSGTISGSSRNIIYVWPMFILFASIGIVENSFHYQYIIFIMYLLLDVSKLFYLTNISMWTAIIPVNTQIIIYLSLIVIMFLNYLKSNNNVLYRLSIFNNIYALNKKTFSYVIILCIILSSVTQQITLIESRPDHLNDYIMKSLSIVDHFVSTGEPITSNGFIFLLPYTNRTIISPPITSELLFTQIDEGLVNHLLIFNAWPIRSYDRFPYWETMINNPPDDFIEVANYEENGVLIFKLYSKLSLVDLIEIRNLLNPDQEYSISHGSGYVSTEADASGSMVLRSNITSTTFFEIQGKFNNFLDLNGYDILDMNLRFSNSTSDVRFAFWDISGNKVLWAFPYIEPGKNTRYYISLNEVSIISPEFDLSQVSRFDISYIDYSDKEINLQLTINRLNIIKIDA